MKQIPLEQRPINKEDFLRRSAAESDTEKVYDEPGIYTLNGKPVIIYGRLTGAYGRMQWAMKTLGFAPESRTSKGGHLTRRGSSMRSAIRGLGESRTFGFRPRIALAGNYCTAASSAYSHPPQHGALCDFGVMLSNLYETAAPEVAAHHDEQLKHISPEWRIPGTRFTSGIVNRNNPLKYHHDRGNLYDVMSCMVVFRDLCKGGFLSIPEFNARWLLEDRSYFFFDGQSYLHGVTPIEKMNKRAYRYSVVYYALRAMEKCGTLEEEVGYARAEKRARERRRVTPQSDATSPPAPKK